MNSRHLPRRIITRVIVFLLLGAIVNVAVAWRCAYLEPPTYSSDPAIGMTGEWTRSQPHDFPFEFTPEWRTEGNAFGQQRVRYIDDYLHKPLYIFLEEFRVGWPCSSFYGEWWVAVGPHHGGPAGGSAVRYLLDRPAKDVRVRPWMPLLPGFAINTIFYAAILWLLFFAPGSVRRTLRRRRGLCPASAYPIGTSPVCTECGKSVLLKSVEPT